MDGQRANNAVGVEKEMKMRKCEGFGIVIFFIVLLGVQAMALANSSSLPEILKCIYDFSTEGFNRCFYRETIRECHSY